MIWGSCNPVISHNLLVAAELNPLVLDKLYPVPHEIVRKHINDALDALADVPIIYNNFCICN